MSQAEQLSQAEQQSNELDDKDAVDKAAVAHAEVDKSVANETVDDKVKVIDTGTAETANDKSAFEKPETESSRDSSDDVRARHQFYDFVPPNELDDKDAVNKAAVDHAESDKKVADAVDNTVAVHAETKEKGADKAESEHTRANKIVADHVEVNATIANTAVYDKAASNNSADDKEDVELTSEKIPPMA